MEGYLAYDLRPGRLVHLNATGTFAFTAPPVSLHLLPIVLPSAVVVDQIGITVTTAGSADAAGDIGLIQANPDGDFGAWVIRATYPAGQLNATGNRPITIPRVALAAGLYWTVFKLTVATTPPSVRSTRARIGQALDTTPDGSSVNTVDRVLRFAATANIGDDFNAQAPVFVEASTNASVFLRIAERAENGIIAATQANASPVNGRWGLPTALPTGIPTTIPSAIINLPGYGSKPVRS